MRAGSLVQGDASEAIIAEVGFDLLDPQRFDLKTGQAQVDGFIFFVGLLRCGIGSQGHGNVNVFEDPAGSDAQDSVTGFHQVVPFTAAVLPSEMVGEGKTGIELFGFDQESRAVRFPFNGFHDALTRRVLLGLVLKAKCVWDEPTFCCEDEGECTVELHAGQFRFLVQFEENNVLGFDAETSLKQEIKNVTL